MRSILPHERVEQWPGFNLAMDGLPCWFSWWRFCLQCRRPGFNPWVGKVPWRRERPPTRVSWPGEFHGLYSPWGHKAWDMTKQLSLSLGGAGNTIQKWHRSRKWTSVLRWKRTHMSTSCRHNRLCKSCVLQKLLRWNISWSNILMLNCVAWFFKSFY